MLSENTLKYILLKFSAATEPAFCVPSFSESGIYVLHASKVGSFIGYFNWKTSFGLSETGTVPIVLSVTATVSILFLCFLNNNSMCIQWLVCYENTDIDLLLRLLQSK